jgi:hypothetical protein
MMLFGFMMSGVVFAKGNTHDSMECHQKSKAGEQHCRAAVKAPVKVNLVLETQKQLNRLGYNAGRADGVMGKNTREAIMRFQRQHHEAVNGKTSPALLEKLKATVKR